MKLCPRCEVQAVVSAGRLMVCQACGYEVEHPQWHGLEIRPNVYNNGDRHSSRMHEGRRKNPVLPDDRPRDGGRILPVFLDEEGE
jgi:hypothetical protein